MKKTYNSSILIIFLFLGNLYCHSQNWNQLQLIIPSDADSVDYFGWRFDSDLNFAVVGSWGDKDFGPASGSVYIYYQNDTSWIFETKLICPDSLSGGRFGFDVSISGNYIIIGAPGDTVNGLFSGSAYIFKKNGTNWINQAKLIPNDGESEDWFGRCVSINGDHAIVSAYKDDDNGPESGSAYIFQRNDTLWNQQSKLLAFDGSANDQFGYSVSITDSFAVVGARYYDYYTPYNDGAVFVFNNNGSEWVADTMLVPSDGDSGDWFGYSIHASGNNIIVGANRNDDNGTQSGSAYIFNRIGDSWFQETKLLASEGSEDDLFGSSVFISDNHAVVSALGDTENGFQSGSVYTFHKDINLWIEESKIIPIDGATQDWFGVDVSKINDMILIGADGNDDFGPGSGSVYVFEKDCESYSYQEISICEGDSIFIGGSYQTSSGVYYDTVLNTQNCDSIIEFTLSINPTYYFSEETLICNGDYYFWQGTNYSEPGLYIVPFSNIFGCDSIYELHLSVQYVDTSVTMNDDTLYAIAEDADYQWLKCPNYLTVPGATYQTFSPNQTGDYAVKVIQMGCVDTSNCYPVIITNTKYYLENSEIQIYPNPADKFIKIIFERIYQEINIEIIDMCSRTKHIDSFRNAYKIILDIEDLNPGAYFVKISAGNNEYWKKIIVE